MGSSPPTKRGELGSTSDDDGYSSDSTLTSSLLEKEKGFGMSTSDDVEAQQHVLSKETESGRQGAEYSVPAKTKYIYLAVYFGLNLGLTLFNKAVLGKVGGNEGFRVKPALADTEETVRFPMAAYRHTHRHCSTGLLDALVEGLLHFDNTHDS